MGSKHKQPNSKHCFVCGLENPIGLNLRFFINDDGTVETEFKLGEAYQGYPGIVHGGVVASILDEVLGRVHMGSDPEQPRFMYTAKLDVRYRKPVPINRPLKAIGYPIKVKKRSATSHAELLSENGEVLVEADGLLVNVPEALIEKSDLEALGWKIYEG